MKPIDMNIQYPKKQLQETASRQMKFRNDYVQRLIVIGTSAGGPKALHRVISDLPKTFNTPVLIVQHMPAGFTNSLAKRLDSLTELRVKEAEHDEVIQNGTIYIAPGDFHMEVQKVGTKLLIKLNKEQLVHGHRPAVDVLFESVSNLKIINKIAVILTGMGSDGAKGITLMKQKDENVIVIGEAEETSVVYGMPKAAFNTGLVDKILPIHDIGGILGKLASS